MYSYPAGTRFGEGPPTENRIVRQARPFTLNDISYNLSHFADAALLESLGIKQFIEDGIEQDFDGGVPVDIETATTIHRTYPNKALNPAKVKAREKAAAVAELAQLDTFMSRGLEDLCEADASFKNKLSQFNKDRIERKKALRLIIVG